MSRNGYISDIGEDISINQLEKCMAVVLPDLIMSAKFQNQILRGYNFFMGLISRFSIEFCMDL